MLRTSFVCESMEGRTHFAATVDPKFSFTLDKVSDAIGTDARVFQAVPAKNGRTYLLADRYTDTYPSRSGGRTALLTVIAVNDAGDPDPTFATGGVALTGRVIRTPDDAQSPGTLKVDGRGRIYFADNTRVIRLRANGTIDRTFGDNGAKAFSTDDRPAVLNDISVQDDGDVLVATMSVTDDVERFAVQRVGRRVRTIWEAVHDTVAIDSLSGKDRYIDGGSAQFAQGGGVTFLVRIQTDGVTYTDPTADEGQPGTVIGARRQDAIVTRFDAKGHVKEVARRELIRRSEYAAEVLGSEDGSYAHVAANNVLLNARRGFLFVQTDNEQLRFNLNNGTYIRQGLPGVYELRAQNLNPSVQLLSDGGFAVTVNTRDGKGRGYTQVYKYNADRTPDLTFGDRGVLAFTRADYAKVVNTGSGIDQAFLDSAGRLNLLLTGRGVGSTRNLTLRRV